MRYIHFKGGKVLEHRDVWWMTRSPIVYYPGLPFSVVHRGIPKLLQLSCEESRLFLIAPNIEGRAAVIGSINEWRFIPPRRRDTIPYPLTTLSLVLFKPHKNTDSISHADIFPFNSSSNSSTSYSLHNLARSNTWFSSKTCYFCCHTLVKLRSQFNG